MSSLPCQASKSLRRVCDIMMFNLDPMENLTDPGLCSYVAYKETLKQVFNDNGKEKKEEAPKYKIYFDFTPSDSNAILSTILVNDKI